MSKSDQTILIVAISVLILFLLNYFVTVPTVTGIGEGSERVVELDAELEELAQDIARGAELETAIAEIDTKIAAMDIDRYYDENYSVHNFFVDSAANYNLTVGALSLSEVSSISANLTDGGTELIAENPLIINQMTIEEINAILPYYEIVSQSTSILVTGTPESIFDYIDGLAKNDIYIALPSLSLTDFQNNEVEISTSLQFTQYMYREAVQQATTEITLQ